MLIPAKNKTRALALIKELAEDIVDGKIDRNDLGVGMLFWPCGGEPCCTLGKLYVRGGQKANDCYRDDSTGSGILRMQALLGASSLDGDVIEAMRNVIDANDSGKPASEIYTALMHLYQYIDRTTEEKP